MENASKALIIAGAILLSILIIGLGMLIFSQAREVLSDTGMSQQQINVYNSEFTQYEGTQNGVTVRTLIDNVRAHNATYINDPAMQIGIHYGTDGVAKDEAGIDNVVDASALTSLKTKISSGKRYKITCSPSKAGRVIDILIEDPT